MGLPQVVVGLVFAGISTLISLTAFWVQYGSKFRKGQTAPDLEVGDLSRDHDPVDHSPSRPPLPEAHLRPVAADDGLGGMTLPVVYLPDMTVFLNDVNESEAAFQAP
ncbi:uncharacterized protein PG998_000054 [Apiospora kogelbergensis]|uniref:uncharacterized protein n=1 Tax=Apiospora kogelbergensis TaxID=1337665 RepID=UPI0031303BE6